MPNIRPLENTAELLEFFSADAYLHLYEIGDLDDFFRPRAKWFAYPASGSPQSVFLLYDSGGLPVLLALEEKNKESSRALLRELLPYLPKKFYAHLSPHLSDILRESCRTEYHGRYIKMRLEKLTEPKKNLADLKLKTLGASQLGELKRFYEMAYPENWFDARMLETGQFLGGYMGGRLCGVAGIHVYSEKFAVAALGNIAVAADCRSLGLGKILTYQLCKSMTKARMIGLNVNGGNMAAVKCYRSIGFELHASYDEFMAYKL